MKYRAPVTLVSRAMEGKVDELKTIEEEKAAADAQLKFEKDLNDIQNLLDELNMVIGQGRIHRQIPRFGNKILTCQYPASVNHNAA